MDMLNNVLEEKDNIRIEPSNFQSRKCCLLKEMLSHLMFPFKLIEQNFIIHIIARLKKNSILNFVISIC